MATKRRTSAKAKSPLLKKITGILTKVFLWFLMVTVLWVLFYRFVNPPITLLMIQRNIERSSEDKPSKMEKKWVDFDDMSDNMKRAAVSAEDQLFLKHIGFDVKAIEKAFETNKKGKKIKGGSTISQQTAKNVFLWPGRSWIRKGFEAYFTLLIEIFWSKERILEVYLNVIEMGDGIYGAEAASQAYYGKSCTKLSRAQAALIASCFPNPRRWSPKNATPYIRHRQYLIMKNMRRLGPLDF
ncbi:monofunctional biosynthetic peptidoglycan transglycosylase [Pedobacter steynii]|uniref:Biosynthetic peptidoglycan transglycosylase n=1 Tax=Pedobacter steynii TaxID=430522 RepID=A0A1H0MCW9_9SPHI|nr:monofunctional biosynthetic peptidoglycan transglycosylase [Pedobacter steynii]NQX43630.1 monofunctional biosynthetic peptidoglycan transglycosylase [Pedobacter steynii]SDO78269.1 monofunctional biosynthetic peptidoglycan transglycosylase [Pedobacter steynii]